MKYYAINKIMFRFLQVMKNLEYATNCYIQNFHAKNINSNRLQIKSLVNK